MDLRRHKRAKHAGTSEAVTDDPFSVYMNGYYAKEIFLHVDITCKYK